MSIYCNIRYLNLYRLWVCIFICAVKHVTVQGSVMLLHLSLARLGWSLPCLTCKPLAAISGPAFNASADVHSLPHCLLLLVINDEFRFVNILPPCATVSMPKDVFSYISTTPQITVPLAIPATSMVAETLMVALGAFPAHSPACLSAPASTCQRNSFPGTFSIWTPQTLPGPSPSSSKLHISPEQSKEHTSHFHSCFLHYLCETQVTSPSVSVNITPVALVLLLPL